MDFLLILQKYMTVRIFGFLLFITFVSCKNKEIEENKFYEKLDLQRKEVLLENIGKKYFEKNCYVCHANKGAKDNFLENAVRNQKYSSQFFIDFITKQDSLLKNGNKDALAIKEWSNYNSYVHNFELNNNEIKAILYYLKK